MSAIAALWRPEALTAPEAECAAMIAAQARYGPDAAATATLGGSALGRALTRMLPEDTHDRQPLLGGDGRFLLVADVRLDNRDELTDQLDLPPSDRRYLADAALLLAAWERWEKRSFDHIVGEYAFALFDARERRLTIARDPLGNRPLFWSRQAGQVAVASMPAGLHTVPGIARQPDPERVARLLAWIPAGERSFYKDVQRVEPGNAVCFDASGHQSWRHWNPRRSTLRLARFEDYIHAYREQLDQATAARLRRRQESIAAQLSGGWDSSAVVGTAARLLASQGGRITAYTSVPRTTVPVAEMRNRFSDEGPLAAAVAAMHPNVNHVLVPGTGGSPIATLGTHLDVYGRPMLNLCNHVWLDEIHRRTQAAGARVLLTGAIGNFTISSAPATLLADYLRAGRWGAWLRESVGAIRDRRARLRGVLASSFEPWIPRPLWSQLERFSSMTQPRAALPVGPLWERQLADEITADDDARRTSDFYTETLASVRDLDTAEYRKGVLARWGVEERDPTADQRIVEFMMSLPLDMFLKNGTRRPLARAALADRVPEVVLAEKKKGYQASDWHQGLTADLPAVRALAERIAADPVAAEVVDVALVRRLLDNWPTGGWTDPLVTARYRSALLLALSAGHFLVAA